MHTTIGDDFLINNSKSQRYVITFIVSVALLYLLLLVPIKIAIQQNKQQTINLILSKTSIVEAEKLPKKEPKIILEEKPITKAKKPVVQTKKEKKSVAATIIKKSPVKVVHLIDPIKKPSNKVKKQESLPSTAVLLNSIKTRKTVQLSQEFQAKTGHEEDFVYKSVEQAEMFKEFKLINEEIDKPQYEMNFYSEGIEGSVERFMDKITYKKKFTTRYGTKIECISVAIVITACGWK